MTDVAAHYAAGGRTTACSRRWPSSRPDDAPLTLEQLGGFDEFHSGGRMATDQLAALLALTPDDVVLDAGSGLGGASRYLADRFGCRVIGIDLTPEFVAVARHLDARTGLDRLVDARVGDLTALDLDDDSVDVAWMCHVSMNVPDKAGLLAELARVLRPGGRLGLFEIVAGPDGGALEFPVPWATEASGSHLVTADALRALLDGAGFPSRSGTTRPHRSWPRCAAATRSSSPLPRARRRSACSRTSPTSPRVSARTCATPRPVAPHS